MNLHRVDSPHSRTNVSRPVVGDTALRLIESSHKLCDILLTLVEQELNDLHPCDIRQPVEELRGNLLSLVVAAWGSHSGTRSTTVSFIRILSIPLIISRKHDTLMLFCSSRGLMTTATEGTNDAKERRGLINLDRRLHRALLRVLWTTEPFLHWTISPRSLASLRARSLVFCWRWFKRITLR